MDKNSQNAKILENYEQLERIIMATFKIITALIGPVADKMHNSLCNFWRDNELKQQSSW